MSLPLKLLCLLAGATLGCETARAGTVSPAPPNASALPSLSSAPVASAPPVAKTSATVAPPRATPCPPEMAHVGKNCVDRWEAHLVAADGGAHPHTARPERGVTYTAKSAPDVMPQAYVNRLEAAAACEQAGKRLCTLRQWFAACRARSGQVFPYGASYRAGVCNSGKPHLLTKLYGRDSRKWKYMEHFNSPELNSTPGFLAKTAEYAGCTNEHGTFDMVGNLHEWVSDTVDQELPNKVPLHHEILEKLNVNLGHAIFMGGFYGNVSEHGDGCSYLTPGHGKNYHDYSTGFRCCRDATSAN
ncbi:MAG: SUMF1/EgtB/PvdO family nonheme iron enzyme [Polyangiaceae bacterium]|nr:SUMF1/EgtB/PvdO family nonheme iron enzyme [Polyangiaceae bacterium]